MTAASRTNALTPAALATRPAPPAPEAAALPGIAEPAASAAATSAYAAR
jgi:hypothetical protein